MAISPLNRSPASLPIARLPTSEPVSAPARGLESSQGAQPKKDLSQMFMADSFGDGPRGLGSAFGSGHAGGPEAMMAQVAQMLGQVMQMLQAMSSQMKGGQGEAGEGSQAPVSGVGGGAGGAAPAPQAAPAAPAAPASTEASKPQSQAPTSTKSTSPSTPAHPTYNSDAGPGFGPPSAGSTEPPPANAPWLAKNNVGTPYNSNIQLIDQGQKSQFKYTNTFTNNTDKPQTITLWNKTGENGNPNDGQNFDKSKPVTFTLQPGQSQSLAFDNNTSVAWSVSKDGSAKPGANSGQTWGEATFGNSTTGWSGFDTSQISPAGHNGKMSIKNDATGKTVTEANAWQTEKDDPAGKDVGVPAGPLHLSTTFS